MPAPCHIARIFGHYQDLGISSIKWQDYACNIILSVVNVFILVCLHAQDEDDAGAAAGMGSFCDDLAGDDY